LRNVDHTFFKKIGLSLAESDISRSLGTPQICSQGTDNHSIDVTGIKNVILYHDVGMTKAGLRALWSPQLHPKYIALLDSQD
jgi:hypothetical protein